MPKHNTISVRTSITENKTNQSSQYYVYILRAVTIVCDKHAAKGNGKSEYLCLCETQL